MNISRMAAAAVGLNEMVSDTLRNHIKTLLVGVTPTIEAPNEENDVRVTWENKAHNMVMTISLNDGLVKWTYRNKYMDIIIGSQADRWG